MDTLSLNRSYRVEFPPLTAERNLSRPERARAPRRVTQQSGVGNQVSVRSCPFPCLPGLYVDGRGRGQREGARVG